MTSYTLTGGIQPDHEYMEKALLWVAPIAVALIIAGVLMFRMWTDQPPSNGVAYPYQTNTTFGDGTAASATTPTGSDANNSSTPTPPSTSSNPVVIPAPATSKTVSSSSGSSDTTPVIGGRGGVGPTSGGGGGTPTTPAPSTPSTTVCVPGTGATLLDKNLVSTGGVCVDP